MENSSMYQTNNKKIKNGLNFYIIIGVIGVAIFLWLFINSISLLNHFNTLKVEDLTQEQLTFQRYERVSGYKSTMYEIHFKEHAKPLVIDNISIKGLDRDALDNLAPNTIVTVYYFETTVKDYDYEICQLTADSVSVLKFDDYIKANKSNQTLGVIISPVAIAAGIFLIVYFAKLENVPPLTEQDERMMKYLHFTIENTQQVLASQTCRCAHCLATFSGAEVTEFTDKGKTAICPNCGEDAVLPDCVEGLDDQLLQEIHDYWFEDDDDTTDDLSE